MSHLVTQRTSSVFVASLLLACSGAGPSSSPDGGGSGPSSTDGGHPSGSDAGSLGGTIQLFLSPDSAGPTQVIDAINGAKTSVHMEMYHLTDTSVVRALVSAHGRSVDVKVILDQSSLTSSDYDASFTTLQAAGVDVVKSSTAFDLTHEKSMVVDEKQAFIMSTNMTDTYTDTRDYAVMTQDSSVIAEWEAVFAADLVNAQSGGKQTPTLSVPSLVWSPVNSESKLTALVAGAKTSVVATVETIDSSTTLASALEAAAKRGVSVRLITPECVENPNPLLDYSALAGLASAGVQVRVMPSPSTATTPYMHGKMIVVDGEEAFVGSENYTSSSLRYDRECGLLFTDSQAVGTLVSTFGSDWGRAIAIPNPLPTNCPAD